jgi:hypothetical protein
VIRGEVGEQEEGVKGYLETGGAAPRAHVACRDRGAREERSDSTTSRPAVTIARSPHEDATIWITDKRGSVETEPALVAPAVWHNHKGAVGNGVANNCFTWRHSGSVSNSG